MLSVRIDNEGDVWTTNEYTSDPTNVEQYGPFTEYVLVPVSALPEITYNAEIDQYRASTGEKWTGTAGTLTSEIVMGTPYAPSNPAYYALARYLTKHPALTEYVPPVEVSEDDVEMLIHLLEGPSRLSSDVWREHIARALLKTGKVKVTK